MLVTTTPIVLVRLVARPVLPHSLESLILAAICRILSDCFLADERAASKRARNGRMGHPGDAGYVFYRGRPLVGSVEHVCMSIV